MFRSTTLALALGFVGFASVADAQTYGSGSWIPTPTPSYTRPYYGGYTGYYPPYNGGSPYPTTPPATGSYYPPSPSYYPPVPAPAQHRYEVQYRQVNWESQCFSSPVEARNFELRKISEGFEVYQNRAGYEIRVYYRMPQWRTYRTVHNHHTAHELVRTLEASGMQARVVHFD